MPLIVSPLLESDIPAFALADEAANQDWPFARAQEVPGIPRHVFVEHWTRDSWGKDPMLKWMKVSEEETGEFVSAALWKFPLLDGESGQAVAKVPTPAPSPAPVLESEANDKEEKAVSNGPGNAALFAAMGEQWEKFTAEYIGDQPFAHLQILMTDPKHQRRGAGSMLVKWGCDLADERGLIVALTASAKGEKVYSKQGFEIKDKYGGE